MASRPRCQATSRGSLIPTISIYSSEKLHFNVIVSSFSFMLVENFANASIHSAQCVPRPHASPRSTPGFTEYLGQPAIGGDRGSLGVLESWRGGVCVGVLEVLKPGRLSVLQYHTTSHYTTHHTPQRPRLRLLRLLRLPSSMRHSKFFASRLFSVLSPLV